MRNRLFLFLIVLVVVSGGYFFFADRGTKVVIADDHLDMAAKESAVQSDLMSVPEVNSPPNILIIMADDLGWNDVGFHGSEIETPNLDALAAEGVELNRFYTHPTCSPTRASLMTGNSAVRHGIIAPLEKINPKGLPLEETTLAERLKDLGYQTALVGKWHLGGTHQAYLPTSRGFDYFYGNLMGGIGYWDHVHGGGYDLQRNGETVRSDEYITHLQAQETIRVIVERDQNKPLFLFASFSAPHLPNEAPAESIEKYLDLKDPKRRVHAAMVSEFDAAVGQIIDALEQQYMLENTLIWFMSDNGGLIEKSPLIKWLPDWAMEKATEKILGEDIQPGPRFIDFARIQLAEGRGNNKPLQGGKTSLWEGGLRVPSVVYWQGTLTPFKSENMIAVQDVLPTLLALTSGENIEGVDGRSVWAALMDDQMLTPNPMVTASGPGAPDFAVIHYPWKLIEEKTGEYRLYHIEQDPTESVELSAQYPVVTETLSQFLRDFPRGENLALPYQQTAEDTDYFGGPEDRDPWAEAVKQ